jgi:hypothetical protein
MSYAEVVDYSEEGSSFSVRQSALILDLLIKYLNSFLATTGHNKYKGIVNHYTSNSLIKIYYRERQSHK